MITKTKIPSKITLRFFTWVLDLKTLRLQIGTEAQSPFFIPKYNYLNFIFIQL